MKMQKGSATAGPSSAIGLMRFFDTEMAGPKFSPQFVIVVAIVIVAAILVMRITM